MSQTRKPDEVGGETVEETPAPPVVEKKQSKTLQELERLQFDALDRAGQGR